MLCKTHPLSLSAREKKNSTSSLWKKNVNFSVNFNLFLICDYVRFGVETVKLTVARRSARIHHELSCNAPRHEFQLRLRVKVTQNVCRPSDVAVGIVRSQASRWHQPIRVLGSLWPTIGPKIIQIASKKKANKRHWFLRCALALDTRALNEMTHTTGERVRAHTRQLVQ